MPSTLSVALTWRMTPAQAEWLRLAGPDGRLPRDWPAGRSGRQGRRRVDMRIVFGCLRQGWAAAAPQLRITEAGRAALASHERDEALSGDEAYLLAAAPA